MSKAAIAALKEALPDIHIFSSVRQSTAVQQTNHVGWSLLEAGERALASSYVEVVEALMKAVKAHV
jgi:chromosome partitioning protein